MAKADFHQFGLMSGRAEARGERALQGGQQACGVLRRLIDRQYVHAQARDARRFAEDVEEGLADDATARVGAVVSPLDCGVNIRLNGSARRALGGWWPLPSDPIEARKDAGRSLSE